MVERLDVEFRSEGVTCRAWLYRADGAGPRPTVVLAGGWCYVREVVMPTYAAAFAAAGLNALVFDYRNLGVTMATTVSISILGRKSATTRTRSRSSSDTRRWTLTALASGVSPIRAGTPSCLQRPIPGGVRSSGRYRS